MFNGTFRFCGCLMVSCKFSPFFGFSLPIVNKKMCINQLNYDNLPILSNFCVRKHIKIITFVHTNNKPI